MRSETATRFELLELLGRGGMGDVYRAWDRELEMEVALKSLRVDCRDDPVLLERFRREIKLARRIKHVNVAQVFDLVELGGMRNISMEYVEGKSLAEILRNKGALPVHVALAIVRQACRGVQAAHDVGVIHRDLKPANLMIRRRDGRACVLDFGIAREAGSSEHTQGGVIVGSPQYMSYEQLAGEHATASSDVYSLGIILYELVTGVSPFRMPGASIAALRALRRVPPDPRQVNPRVPDFVAEAVLRALEPEPLRRFASALDLHDALAAPADDRPRVETIATASGEIAIADSPTAVVAVPDDELRHQLAERLERIGLEVNPVKDCSGVIEAVRSGSPSLIVLAEELPDVDGMTACQVLKQQFGGEAANVLLLIAQDDGQREALARQAGANDVIHLPLNVHAFSRTVRSLVSL